MSDDFLDKELKKINKGLRADEDYNTLLDMWRDEKKRRQMAEGELSIVKGIGNNSPEMKAYKLENQRLKEDLDRLVEENHNFEVINKSHKELNGEIRKELDEVRADNKKLARQIDDMENNYIRIDGKK
tara:strand:- start:193 stop:576 length:384 start_codon:yes stop_codon:yes gene_type:complete